MKQLRWWIMLCSIVQQACTYFSLLHWNSVATKLHHSIPLWLDPELKSNVKDWVLPLMSVLIQHWCIICACDDRRKWSCPARLYLSMSLCLFCQTADSSQTFFPPLQYPFPVFSWSWRITLFTQNNWKLTWHCSHMSWAGCRDMTKNDIRVQASHIDGWSWSRVVSVKKKNPCMPIT